MGYFGVACSELLHYHSHVTSESGKTETSSLGQPLDQLECCKQVPLVSFCPKRGTRSWVASSGPYCAGEGMGPEWAKTYGNFLLFWVWLLHDWAFTWSLQFLDWLPELPRSISLSLVVYLMFPWENERLELPSYHLVRVFWLLYFLNWFRIWVGRGGIYALPSSNFFKPTYGDNEEWGIHGAYLHLAYRLKGEMR